MKMRVLAAGLTAVLITGGGATVAQRIITQKTRGVLPEKDDAAHADSRIVRKSSPDPALRITLATASPAPRATGPGPSPAIETEHEEPALVLDGVDRPRSDSAAAEVPPIAQVEAGEAIEPPQPVTAAAATAEPAPTDPAIRPTATTAPDASGKPDPVDSVDAFVERNRREAESAIASLTTEAANLKTRLAKVEAALSRWQAFAHALNPDPSASQPTAASPGRPGWRRNVPEQPAEPPISTTIEGHVQPTTDPVLPTSPTDVLASPPVPPAGDPAEVPGTDPTPTQAPAPEPAALPGGPKN